jgi:hypothetical protein
MSIEKYHNVTDFGRAIQESSLLELRFVGKSDDGLFEFDTDTDSNMNIGRFKLPVGYVQQKPYLNGILDENGNSVFSGKMVWIDGEFEGDFQNCKGMFAQLKVQTVGYGIKFDDVDVDATLMFNESNFEYEREMKVIGGRLRAKGMFRGCQNKEELKFVYVKFYDITRVVADSSIREMTFYNCDLACSETEFERNTKSCMYKNGKLETINFEGCTNTFVKAMIEHINKYGENDDDIVINIVD